MRRDWLREAATALLLAIAALLLGMVVAVLMASMSPAQAQVPPQAARYKLTLLPMWMLRVMSLMQILPQNNTWSLIHGAHGTQQIAKQAVEPLHKGGDTVRHDDHKQPQKEKTHYNLDGKAKFHNGYLRRGTRHQPQRNLNQKQSHHDRRSNLQGQHKHL